MTPTLVFDIETVPDIAGCRRLFGLPDSLDDEAVGEFIAQQRRVATGSDFVPHYLQRIVAIACALREGSGFRVWSLGDLDDPEPELLRRFFDGIGRYTPQLVSWNGGGFDLPVIHHRSLLHGVPAARYWERGDDDREFRYNNYLSRYHNRHLDLMDVLASYQPRAYAPLDGMAQLCGFPGKIGMDGSQVWPAFRAGKIDAIRRYCESDVLNTYLLFLRFQLMRGCLNAEEYASEISLVRERLGSSPESHWKEYFAAWDTVAAQSPFSPREKGRG